MLLLCLIKGHAMKRCMEWRYSSTILHLATRHAPAAMPSGKEPAVPIRWVGWAPEPVWTPCTLLLHSSIYIVLPVRYELNLYMLRRRK
jgi:hypothetical protein